MWTTTRVPYVLLELNQQEKGTFIPVTLNDLTPLYYLNRDPLRDGGAHRR